MIGTIIVAAGAGCAVVGSAVVYAIIGLGYLLTN